ncbi:MAG: DUF7391 family protein [Candidatus Aquicultorales bacterium]
MTAKTPFLKNIFKGRGQPAAPAPESLAAQWKANGTPVELPSGNTAKLRRFNIFYLLKEGKVPNHLASIVQGFISSPAGPDLGALVQKKENLDAMLELLEITAKSCFVDPRVVDNPTADNEIGFSEIALDDLLYVWGWAQGEAVSLESFREDQERAVAGFLSGEGLPGTPLADLRPGGDPEGTEA